MSRMVTIVVISVLVMACDKSEGPTVNSSLAFGEAYGFCVGDCAHFFQLNNNVLYQDNIERFSGDEPTFDSTPLEKEKLDLAKSLVEDFPEFLLNNKNMVFGCPDCADQGGIHLFLNTQTEKLFWHIDTNIGNQPPEIRDYLKQVRDVTAQLRK